MGSSNGLVFGGSFARTFLTKLCNKMVAPRSTISRHISSCSVGIFVSMRIERKEIIINRKYLCISLTMIYLFFMGIIFCWCEFLCNHLIAIANLGSGCAIETSNLEGG